jgi:hypothetical protein
MLDNSSIINYCYNSKLIYLIGSITALNRTPEYYTVPYSTLTPSLFAKFQNEILEIMSIGSSIREVRALMPEVFQHLEKYKHMLKEDALWTQGVRLLLRMASFLLRVCRIS